MFVTRELVVSLINNDDSGLNEENLVFLEELNEYVGMNIIDILNEETLFVRCDITGLFSDCLEIELVAV